MRIALLHPTYWPEVRRGSERLAHDLGASLAGRGHDVTLLTSHDAATTNSLEDGIRVIRERRPPLPPGAKFYEDHVASAPQRMRRLLGGEFDVAHALLPVEGWAASQARRLGGPPYVLSIHGVLNREYLVNRRYRLEMLRTAVAGAAVTSVLSEAAAEPFRRYALGDPVILPGGVICADYAGERSPADSPTLLCAASLGDPRKRGPFLLDAFARLRARTPDARLLLAGGQDPYGGLADDGLREGVERLEIEHTDSLARAYRSAWATVLPSIHEAFGLVLLESLASGTPVVAARSGGAPDVAGGDGTGRLFEPDDEEDLARAMSEALELSTDPGASERCREQARRFDWGSVVESYERVYERAVSGEPRAPQ
jgi:glycosyltransferase involved in cell wall biosynthesis